MNEFKYLAECLDSLEIIDSNQNTAMHYCCSSDIDAFEKLQYLATRELSLIKKRNRSGNLPVHMAARNKDKHMLEYLLTLG